MTTARARRANRRAMLLERTGITPFLSRSFAVLLVILIACPLVLWLFERRANAEIQTVPKAYFWMWRTLMEQGSPLEFQTAGGWLVSYLVVIVGVGLVATGPRRSSRGWSTFFYGGNPVCMRPTCPSTS